LLRRLLADFEADLMPVAAKIVELRGFQLVMGDRAKGLPYAALFTSVRPVWVGE
jgi:hypothetical protein